MNKIIKYIRDDMSHQDKEKAATVLLNKMETPNWNFKKIYKELEGVINKPYNPSTLQKLKPGMFEMLAAMCEGE